MTPIPRELPLSQNLFLLGHTPLGQSIVDRPQLTLGLAGAVLIELAIAGRIHAPRFFLDVRPEGCRVEPLAETIANELATVPVASRTPHHAIRRIATDIDSRIAGALLATAIVSIGGRARAGAAYRHTDPGLRDVLAVRIAGWPSAGRPSSGRPSTDVATYALTRLAELIGVAAATGRTRVAPALPATVDALLAATGEVISELVPAGRA